MSKLYYPSGLNRRVIGDWNCPKCNNLNFSFRSICNKCKSEKPQTLFNSALFLSIDGENYTPSGKLESWGEFLNEPISAKPISESAPVFEPKIVRQGRVTQDVNQVEEILGHVKGPDSGRPGDWVCLRCNNLNFAFRKTCNKCNGRKDMFIAL